MSGGVYAIAALARNGVIGKDNALPWRLSEDLKRFKRLTLGHAMLMGRKTYDSIGRALPGRTTLVLTRDPAWRAEGVTPVRSVDEALERARAAGVDLWVVGGAEVYRLALPRVQRFYLTHLEKDVEGDAHFPDVDLSGWRVLEDERHHDAALGADYRFVTYERPG